MFRTSKFFRATSKSNAAVFTNPHVCPCWHLHFWSKQGEPIDDRHNCSIASKLRARGFAGQNNQAVCTWRRVPGDIDGERAWVELKTLMNTQVNDGLPAKLSIKTVVEILMRRLPRVTLETCTFTAEAESKLNSLICFTHVQCSAFQARRYVSTPLYPPLRVPG